jgi:hypothetical protein
MIRYQEYEAEIAKMIDNVETQAANIKRIIPSNPWTKSFSAGKDTTVIGIRRIY